MSLAVGAVDKQENAHMRHSNSIRRARGMAILTVVLTIIMTACAGGLVGSKEKKLAYFNSLEQDTLARLVKEHPQAKQELANSVGYLVAPKRG